MVKGLTGKIRGGIMDKKLKKQMIKEAKKMYSKIFPCGLKESFEECFTLTDDTILLWFNTKDKDTHVLRASRGTKSKVQIS